jgi:hypothetical protein
MGIKTYIFVMFAIFSQQVWAQDPVYRITDISASGKTILINLGDLDQVRIDDYGILFDSENVDQKFYPVAKVKAVRVFKDKSVWVVFERYRKLKKKHPYYFLTESYLSTGRKTLNINRQKIVTTKEISKDVKQSLDGDHLHLAQKDQDYRTEETLHKEEEFIEADVQLVDLDRWSDFVNANQYTTKPIYRSPHIDEFKEVKKIQRFEKMVFNFMEKHHDPQFSLKDYYYEISNEGSNQSGLKRDVPNTFEKYQFKKRKDRVSEEKMHQTLASKGENWSDDYSDEELAELVTNIGIISEKERRATIQATQYSFQTYAAVQTNLLNNENPSDIENTQTSKLDFEVALEAFVFKKFETLNKFSIEGSFRYAKDGLSTGTLNALTSEYSGAATLNWYPFYAPNVIEKNIFYASVIARYGLASAVIDSAGEAGNYSVYGFPGVRIGVKYNLRNGYGVRLTAAREVLLYDRVIRNEDAGDLPDRKVLQDGKVGIGLSYLF